MNKKLTRRENTTLDRGKKKKVTKGTIINSKL